MTLDDTKKTKQIKTKHNTPPPPPTNKQKPPDTDIAPVP